MNKRSKVLMFTIFLFTLTALSAYGAMSRSSSSERQETKKAPPPAVSLYDQGVAANKSSDYRKAVDLFERVLRENPDNPDALNMLAHSQRKLGLIDESLENYRKALELRPRFPEAREYAGEAYIQAALREIRTLRSYGEEGKENLEDLTKEFKEAAARL